MKWTVFLKNIVVLISSLAFTPFCLFAHAEKAFYLQGKLGEKSIAVKMICYDETPAIRYVQYFFTNDKRDRYMAGKLVDGYWRFAADMQAIKNEPKPDGTISITPDGPRWKGYWAANKGSKQAIFLTPIPADFMPPQFSQLPLVQEMDPYERYRLATLQFVKTTTQKLVSGLQSSWYIEKESGITFFRLEAGNSKVNMENVNAALEATHLSLVQKYFAYSPQKNDARPTTQLLYLSNELVSFRTVSINRFLSLTTTQLQLATTLDVATGETLKPEDLLWLDKTTAPPAASDFFTLFQYRKRVFAPTIFQWLQQLYPNEMKSERCGINKVESWNLPAWNLTAKGLALDLKTNGNCNVFQWAIIPYDRLKPFIAKKYHL